VLAAFMAGLALGSLVIGRFIDRVPQPQRWYAGLEVGIGLTALATLTLTDHLVPVYRAVYDFAGGSRALLTVGQVVIALLVLFLPTALMGATLPTLCAYGGRVHQNFSRSVGVLYSLNTLGAVLGILASGFVLIGEVGETHTLLLGVVLNLAVGVVAYFLGGTTDSQEPAGAEPEAAATDDSPVSRRAVLATFAISGFVALATEVVWSRMLPVYVGTSIYAFSSMLAVVLTGMGLGSLLGGKFVPRWRDPLRRFAQLQLGVGLVSLTALHLFPYITTQRPDQPLVLFWPVVVLLGPLGLLWGLAFPLGAACYTQVGVGAGRAIAALYGWNTVGCIAGSLAAGFLLIPLLGSSHAAASLAAISLLLGLLLIAVHPKGFRSSALLGELILVVATVVLLSSVGDPYFQTVERKMRVYFRDTETLKHVEESTATTTVFRPKWGDPRHIQLWINGEGMTLLAPVTKLMAHLPIALADDPHDVLVICFGMGTTVRSASLHEELEVRAVELVPAVIDSFKFFHADAAEVLSRPNVRVVADDGRNYLLMHRQKYDIITVDPPPPLHSAGCVNLYTREFFALCRQRLRPGGLMCLWIPPDRKSEVMMVLRTYLEAFPHVQAWCGPEPHAGFLLIGTEQPLAMAQAPAKIRKLYDRPAVAEDLRAWGPELDSPQRILDLYCGDREQLWAFVGPGRIITDDTPYTEFPLWRSRNKSGDFHSILRAFTYKHLADPRTPLVLGGSTVGWMSSSSGESVMAGVAALLQASADPTAFQFTPYR
jgi:spermidine synthase